MRSGREDDSLTPVYRLELETGRVGVGETVWTCIRDVIASSVSRDTDYADFYGFPVSEQFPCWDMASSFQIISSLLISLPFHDIQPTYWQRRKKMKQ